MQEERTKIRTPAVALPGVRYQWVMFALCILFGLAMIANTFVAGDGLWFWYASLLRNGHRLYADMHLPLQPFFVLETLWAQTILGNGWLIGRLPAVVHLVLYSLGMLLLLRQAPLKDHQKALVFGSAFFVSLLSIAYRFDDYHVLAESFELYSIYLLLKLQHQVLLPTRLALAAALGVLSGLSFTTRVNDGAALLLGVLIAVLCFGRGTRLLELLTLGLAAVFTILAIVHLTGDSFHDYAVNSIFHAAGSKGGAGHVLAYPFTLPAHAFPWLHSKMYVCCFIVSAIWAFFLLPLRKKHDRHDWIKAAAGVLLALLPLRYAIRHFRITDLILGVSALGDWLLYLFGLIVVIQFLRWAIAGPHRSRWNPKEILMLIPLGQLASLTMSTGGMHYGVYGPLAVLILLLPIASPIRLRSPALRSTCMGMAAILIVYAAVFRFQQPYAWHSYESRPMFAGRQWYRHPVYGPMIIETEMLHFITPVCNFTGMSDPAGQFLSLPYPFGNYFCAAPPWHGYVQTYYDTSTRQTIDSLVTEFEVSPPRWILYQRQPESIAIHEKVFNNGQPLPQRRIERLIDQKLATGSWSMAYTGTYGSNPVWTTQWLLIDTASHAPAREPAIR